MSSVFIVGSARSGTTSLVEALGLSSEAHCLSEPSPNLNHESRAMFEGRLTDPTRVLIEQLGPRVAAGLDLGKVYVEKQVSLVPFVRHLHALFRCKFLVPVRDGREVVTSLMNWHQQMFPIVYSEAGEPEPLGEHAAKIRAAQVGQDPFDYSLPRPPPADPWYADWARFSRFEMVSWYWAYVNRQLHELVQSVPAEDVLFVDYTRPTVESLRKVYDFCGLGDWDESRVRDLLARRVNSLRDRGVDEGGFPGWQRWSTTQLGRFYDLAGSEMRRLGYGGRSTPRNFGNFWRDGAIDVAWYERAFDYRRPSHEMFTQWVDGAMPAVREGGTVVELGCGLGIRYRDLFAKSAYTGVDLIPKAIEWCKEHDTHAAHRYVCADPVEAAIDAQGELVFSHATVDNVYDIDAFLLAHARLSSDAVYVANYRGFFGDMYPHRYRWDEASGVGFNDVSPRRSEEVLTAAGFASVLAFPVRTQREDIPVETVIVATRGKTPWRRLTAGHELYHEYAPYEASVVDYPAPQLLALVDNSCSPYSAGDAQMVNGLADFRTLLADVSAMPGRRIGNLGSLARGDAAVNTAFRVDVDMDLSTALGMARIAGERAVPLTFFVLHTAYYYGRFADGRFERYAGVRDVLLQLQGMGAEIGLHVDALGLYLDHGLDGAAGVVSELAWLRSAGLRIRGTTGHNAAPIYGAENLEIFKGRDIRGAGFGRKGHRYFPLGLLDEQALGLEYEGSLGCAAATADDAAAVDSWLVDRPSGNFVRNRRWFHRYLHANPYCTWAADFNVWVLGRGFWAVSGRRGAPDEVFRFGVGWSEVAALLRDLPADARVVFTLHPIYFGFRALAGAAARE